MNNKIRRSALLAVAASTQGVFDIDNYLTIVALEDGLTASLSTNAVEYCVDGDENWTTLAAGATSPAINTGQTLSFRGNLTPASSNGIGTFTISKSCDLTGNCNSLLFGDDAKTNLSLSGKNYVFRYLFQNCTTIRNVSSNFLPATTLSSYCYYSTFYGCTSLTTAPELPATTLTEGCYHSMFNGCTSLTTAPELPATTLATHCYQSMFSYCGLTTAPQLPATTLASYCYYSMFAYCGGLKTAPELPATTLASYCYSGMFGHSGLKTAPQLPATTLASNCYYSMFTYCGLTTAPELPATTLATSCYSNMFNTCSSLTTAPELPATTLVDNCYSKMFRYCRSLTTAPELPATTLVDNCYSGMFCYCSRLKYIKAMFITTPSSTYTSDWVLDVASAGTFVKNKYATWDVTGSSGIPSGWTVELYALFTPQQCLSLSIEADDISGKETSTTVYYTATVKGLDGDGNTVTKTITGEDTVEVGQNTSTTNSVTKTVSYTYMGVTATTTITQGVYNSSYYSVNLNSQWQLSTTVGSPSDITVPYDGIYESYSNKGTGNSGASMYINIDGYTNFKFYIRSYAESNYDYVMVSQLDKTLTYSSSYSDTTLVKAHTRGNQQSGTALSNYTLVEFTNIDGGSHTIQIIYRKDSSVDNNDDRGYVIIPREQ